MKRISKIKTLLAVLGAVAVNPMSAAVIDLVNGNTGTANGTIYNWVAQQSTGTGVIDPFLRLQATGGGPTAGLEQGYNNDVGTPWDTKAPGNFTHDLQKSDLVSVVIGGVTYYEFLLDINQNVGGDNELLSLNQVQIFSRVGAIATAPDSTAGLGTLQYDSDVGAQGDSTVELDFTRNPGSGAGDMLMYVLASLFDDVAASDYIYFYSLFGNPHTANDGIEEWSLRLAGTPPSVPDAGVTVALLGMGMLGIGAVRRKLS